MKTQIMAVIEDTMLQIPVDSQSYMILHKLNEVLWYSENDEYLVTLQQGLTILAKANNNNLELLVENTKLQPNSLILKGK